MTEKPAASDVFDESRDGISDAQFLALIDALRADGATWFTARQLYARACLEDAIPSRVLGLLWLTAGLLSALGFVTAFVGPLLGQPILALVGGAAVMISMAVFMIAWLMPMPVPSERTVQRWLDTWSAAGRPLPCFVRKPTLDDDSDASSALLVDEDSVRSIVIVEHDVMVDLLVRNGLQRKLGAIIVSEHGYPARWRSVVAGALATRPGLPVLLLHDATAEGTSMQARVRRSRALALKELGLTERHLTDLGLFPHEVEELTELEPVSPRARGYVVSLEMLPWKTLAEALPRAVRDCVPLAHAITAGWAKAK